MFVVYGMTKRLIESGTESKRTLRLTVPVNGGWEDKRRG